MKRVIPESRSAPGVFRKPTAKWSCPFGKGKGKNKGKGKGTTTNESERSGTGKSFESRANLDWCKKEFSGEFYVVLVQLLDVFTRLMLMGIRKGKGMGKAKGMTMDESKGSSTDKDMTMDESKGSGTGKGMAVKEEDTGKSKGMAVKEEDTGKTQANAEIFEAVRRVAWVVASATIPRD